MTWPHCKVTLLVYMESQIADPWHRSEEGSLINLVPPTLAETFVKASERRPDLFGLDEHSLTKLLKSEKKLPTPTDNRLRIAFWTEYNRSKENLDKFNVTNVFAGLCHRSFFYGEYLSRPENVAWMVCPPADYATVMAESLTYGLEQLRDILSMPHCQYDENGNPFNPNIKLMDLKAKIVAMVHERVKGAVVQRVEQKSMNLNLSTTDKRVGEAVSALSMEDIEKRLKELQKKDRMAIEVKSEESK